MKTNHIILASLLFFAANSLMAQSGKFVTDGVIEYEKSVNMFTLLQKQVTPANEASMKPMIDNYKKTQPQFKTMKSNLSFAKDKTLFEPVAPATNNSYGPQAITVLGGVVMLSNGTNSPETEQNNVIYTDINAGTSVSQKTVYEQTFLVKDAARPIKWKITNEVRDIAGYQCRRANGLMLDSIYVVAFYTDDIPVSGGPESFSGLPGMILGAVLPDEHMTWYATKVDAKAVSALKVPTKGKAVTNKELKATLELNLKSRGAQAQNLLKAFLL
jgi:GLPGLI family protein